MARKSQKSGAVNRAGLTFAEFKAAANLGRVDKWPDWVLEEGWSAGRCPTNYAVAEEVEYRQEGVRFNSLVSGETNREGLTFDEWCAAANFGRSQADKHDGNTMRRAWRAGEDPTEYAAMPERRTRINALSTYSSTDAIVAERAAEQPNRTPAVALGLLGLAVLGGAVYYASLKPAAGAPPAPKPGAPPPPVPVKPPVVTPPPVRPQGPGYVPQAAPVAVPPPAYTAVAEPSRGMDIHQTGTSDPEA